MLKKPLVVIDTNVLISAVLWGGTPIKIIKKWQKGKFNLLISPFILAELIVFLEHHGVRQEDKEAIFHEFSTKSVKINPSKRVKICRDKKDNQILDLCFAGKADFLITGDKDLLVLKKFKTTKIIAPKDFLKEIK